jgi:predicted 3-demethylubiquinone-9 3-methyltransferase (glyoxalase superfamily)
MPLLPPCPNIVMITDGSRFSMCGAWLLSNNTCFGVSWQLDCQAKTPVLVSLDSLTAKQKHLFWCLDSLTAKQKHLFWCLLRAWLLSNNTCFGVSWQVILTFH